MKFTAVCEPLTQKSFSHIILILLIGSESLEPCLRSLNTPITKMGRETTDLASNPQPTSGITSGATQERFCYVARSTATQAIGQDGKALLAPYTVFER